MKKINLIEWLSRNSHEKQSPQRFVRYAAMLIMLLTLGVGKMWATTVYYVNRNSWGGVKIHYWGGKNGSNWDSRPSMNKLAYTVNGFEVYSYDIGNNTTLIFMDSSNDSNRDGGDVSFSDSSKPYYFNGWYASFAACWQVKGGYDSWAGTTSTSTGNNTGRVTVNLTANTDFKLYCLANSSWYGSNGGTIPDNTSWTLNGSSNTTLAHTHDGYYVFDIDFSGSNPSVTTHAPYQVSYAAGANGSGSVSASSVTTYGTNCTLSSNTFSRAGYTQDGWSTSDGGGKTYNLGGTYSAYTDITLYPHWAENTYTVTYTAGDGGSVTTPASSSSTVGQVTGVSIVAEADDGYEFVNWTVESGTGSFTDDEDESTTFYPTSTATIQANFRSTAETTHEVTIAYKYGATTIKASTAENVGEETPSSISSASITGYTFSSWSLGDGLATEGETTDDPISITTKASGTYTLTANYNINSYSVTFNAMSGSGSMSNESFNYNQTKALTSNGYTRSGYVFKGWATSSARATAGNIDYLDGANYTMGSANVTLYAVWYKKAYFVNVPKWSSSNVKAHVYTGETAYKAWNNAAEVMTSTGTTVFGYTIYYYEFPDTYTTVKFHNNGDNETDAWTWSSSTPYYYHGASTQYASANAIRQAWKVYGSWNMTGKDWNSNDFSSYSTGTATYTVSLAASTTYNFKYVFAGTNAWYGCTGGTMSDGDTWTLDGESNVSFTTTVAGTYTFTIDYSKVSTNDAPDCTLDFPVSYTLTYSIGSVAGNNGSISTSPTTASGSKVISGSSITLTAPAAAMGYTWKGWYTNAGGTEGKIADTNRAISVTMDADKTLYACYTEDKHDVTINKGTNSSHGSINVTSANAGIATASSTITATPNTGYYFTGWTGDINDGVTLASGTTTSTSITINATADSKTITANFAPEWVVAGSMLLDGGNWDTETNMIENIELSSGDYVGYVEMDLPANTDYQFKMVQRSTGEYTWYGNSNADAAPFYMTYTGDHTDWGFSSSYSKNCGITTAGSGTYRFTWNITDKTLTVTFPTSYTVTFGKVTSNGVDKGSVTATGDDDDALTSGKYVAKGSATFTASDVTGYTFQKWSTSNTYGSGTQLSTSNPYTMTSIGADKTVYAQYSVNTFTITYDNMSGASNHASNPASYTVENLPVTLYTPTKTGYTFGNWKAKDSSGATATSIAAGSKLQDTTFYATWTANEYTITLNQNGATTDSDPTSLTATYDATAPVYDAGASAYKYTITNPEKTGYTFAGWFENEGGAGHEIITQYGFFKHEDNPYVDATGHWKNAGNVEVYAKWTPNNYAVTLSTSGETGYGSSAPSNQTATYGMALPTITPPVGAPGYKFQGYFTSAGGAGTKYYNADGTSAANWNIAEARTLHAYFLEAEITSLVHETSVAKAEEADLVVNPVLNVVPEDYIAICWTLHYADNDNPVDGEHWDVEAYTENGDKPYQVKYTFTNLASGSYYVKATLRKSASAFSSVCTDGTKMMDIHGDFHVVGNNTVTVRYLTTDFGSDFVLKAPTEVEIEAMSTAEITAPEIPGYTFNRWYLGDGISKESGEYTSATITISATYDGVITARYAKKKMVYFNNTVGWDTVFVYFYNGAEGNKYWDNGVGAGANQEQSFNGNKPFYQGYYGGMKRVAPGSNIWYFDYLAAGFSEGNISSKISFAAKDQAINKSGATDAEAFFYETEAIFRDDFDPANLPMYVPLTSPTTLRNSSTTKYYDQGYWMNYPESTGYELRFYNKRSTDGSGAPYELVSKRHKFEFTGDKTLPLSVSLDLEAGHDYYFKIYRVDGTYYGNNAQMTNGHSGDEGQPAWEFKTGTENAWVTASGAGNYTFTLTYGIDLSSNYNYLVGVRYPESTGDFRVLYSDAVRVTNHSSEGASWLASYVIPKTTESDTVSFFVRKASTPKIKAQKCTATYDEGTGTTTVTWTDENEGEDLLPDTISADGVYNFIFTKSGDNLVLSAVEPYTGNFYIRVDGAGTSNWDNFRASDHLMPYSDYSFKQEDEPYSHYFTQWYEPNPEGKPVEAKNIKFVVANDYSACVSDTIVRDGIADNYVDANGWLSGRNANIRFMYNYKTNAASRRYIDGAQEDGSEFLLLIPEDDDMIFDAETEGSAYSQVKFSDKGNWLYEANVWVVPGTTYKLKSNFGVAPNLVVQYFKGAESGDGEFETLVGGSGSSRLQIRLLYDFKTNRIVSAYVPSSTISGNLAINADVMFIREGQGEMQQLTFENDATLSAITNVYSVLRFNKWTLNNRYTTGGHGLVADPKSIYERSLYFVSFPFDVKLSDVFGFGTYWDEWYIEYYDGAARAKNGFWIDSDSYWKYVTPAMKDTFTLKAGQGYIFGLDLDYLECYGEGEGQQANIWKNIQTADFIFPGNVSSISNSSVTYTLPAHTCTINRGTGSGNRTIADSHWNVLGVPTYLNTTSVTFEETTGDWMTDGKPKYIYSWNPQDNSLTPTSAAGFTYHSMNAYVVQYYGNVTFSTSVSAAAAPRRNPEYRGEYEFRLEIQKNDESLDQTYVRLSDDEEVTANFEFGYDLTKAQTGRAANLYTIIEGYLEAAGNTLPLTNQTTIVPVGVKVNNAGDFTFSMPDGTEGIGVTLIDNETGISTQLSALDYTINLAAGTYNNRFLLVISPISQIPTNVDLINSEMGEDGARKVIIDQKMYIICGNELFDARGAKVK